MQEAAAPAAGMRALEGGVTRTSTIDSGIGTTGPAETRDHAPGIHTWDGAQAKLEMERVRQRVLRYATSEPGAEMIRQSGVMTSLSDIRLALARVTEMKRLLEEEEDFPLSGVHPVAPALQKSAIEGAVLLPRELLQIGSLARASRIVKAFLARRKDTLLWEIAEPLGSDSTAFAPPPMPVFMTTVPLTPAPPVWMWNPVKVTCAGKV